MRILVKIFGSLREEAGTRELAVELPARATVAELRRAVGEQLEGVGRLGDRLAVSVNLEVADPATVLREGDEVALLPPVSGGAGGGEEGGETGLCTISERPLDEAEVVARVDGPDAGGIVSFVGNVRNHSRGQSIDHLEYDAYPAMAEREMQKIAEQAGKRWPGTRVAIAHRIGRLEIGDAAVVVAAASKHRAEAFEACRFAIDTLKQTVPIWKKEVATGGEYWVDDHA